MIGVTIISPEYQKSGIADEAIRRFREHTGLVVFALYTNHERNYTAKLQLTHLSQSQSIVFFDCDLWFIKDVDLSIYNDRDEFFAVKDSENHKLNCENWPDSFSYQDCENLGMDKSIYFNGGFMIFNHRHKSIFDNALNHLRSRPNDFKDFGEQSSVNFAVQRSNFELNLLPVNYNCMVGGSSEIEEICKDPYTLHPAGVSLSEKIPHLNYVIDKLEKKK